MPADKLAQLKLTVNEEAFKHITGTAAKYVPELEQRDWAIISDSNALCYGLRVIRVKGQDGDDTSRGTPIGVERARRAGMYRTGPVIFVVVSSRSLYAHAWYKLSGFVNALFGRIPSRAAPLRASRYVWHTAYMVRKRGG